MCLDHFSPFLQHLEVLIGASIQTVLLSGGE